MRFFQAAVLIFGLSSAACAMLDQAGHDETDIEARVVQANELEALYEADLERRDPAIFMVIGLPISTTSYFYLDNRSPRYSSTGASSVGGFSREIMTIHYNLQSLLPPSFPTDSTRELLGANHIVYVKELPRRASWGRCSGQSG
ncbi:hypothetical protein LZ32DRAFT_662513 [Colletotrichum eremochloae]|nr:hypothetical protein LZ32DRAFT_662513 [Colletotrichum eremochloae]